MLRSKEILYELLRDKTVSQEFYNGMMVRMVNPLARDIFKMFRDEDERDLLEIRGQYLALESKAMVFKSFVKRITS
ncbi:MAG: hypothetical protein ACOY40_07750 [Bacillota bacterium]